ncbi:DUF4234 domain-containing protein [Clostridium frigidicarnis]|uniref:DUF4234 domain-containing protein n=1 Tax=Clostridium frigidicarnis TaxID=84698 RepID=A0A1I1AN32_9CLOT|nr:DUF4234 domain-containing protein [Clostridium frigidicarnis]SFB39357.1 protein of unknown function [Clostridium frigidicarnis]
MRKRNIFECIILSILTCGIYFLVWMVMLSNDLSRYDGEPEEGGLELVYSIVTCGIYYIYWNYKMGKRLYRLNGINNRASDNSVVYLILSIFGFGIISQSIMQSEINDL